MGSAHFKLKPGQSKRVRIKLLHGSRPGLMGFADEQLDLIVRQSAGKGHKPIGFVAGQATLRLR